MPAPDLNVVKANAQREFAQDAGLRAEFTSEAAYVAYCQAAARGVCRVFSKGTEAPTRVVVRVDASEQPAPAADDLARRQALVRQENVGRAFAGLAPLQIPQ